MVISQYRLLSQLVVVVVWAATILGDAGFGGGFGGDLDGAATGDCFVGDFGGIGGGSFPKIVI